MDGTGVDAFVYRCSYDSLERGIMNAHRRDASSTRSGPRPTVVSKKFDKTKSIAMLENVQLKICIKHNLSPSNVLVVPIGDALRSLGGPDAMNKICVDVFEYDSGAARKVNVKAHYHDNAAAYPPTAGDRVMIIGRRNDTFVDMLRRAHTKSPDAYGNEAAVARHVRNADCDSHFGMAVRFFVDRYTSRFERLTDSWYVVDAPGTLVGDIGPTAVIADVASVRTISTGDIIVNRNRLVQAARDPATAAIKEAVVRRIYGAGVDDIACCVRALVGSFGQLLVEPVVMVADIETCFGASFARDPETRMRALAVARILSVNRTQHACTTMIGDAVPMIPVVNILTDDETFTRAFNENVFRYNFLHRVKYDSHLIEFMEGLFGQRYPADLEQCVAANECAHCLNTKCVYGTM